MPRRLHRFQSLSSDRFDHRFHCRRQPESRPSEQKVCTHSTVMVSVVTAATAATAASSHGSDHKCHLLIAALVLFLCVSNVLSVELTFELPDNAKQCFHEDIRQGVKSTVEFQVVTGGHYDVDMTLQGPRGEVLYQGIKKQFDTFTWTPTTTGTYTTCFSNEFSTFSHKLVYFDFQVGEEPALPGTQEHLTAMTKMEQSSVNIHESLNTMIDSQTHYRLNEAKGRKRAEDLNNRVLWWSLIETLVVFLIGIGQVMVLKNFFSDKKLSVTNT